MKAVISVIFLSQIGVIFSSITTEIEPILRKCCEKRFKDGEELQKSCETEMKKEFSGSFIELLLEDDFETADVDAEAELLKELSKAPENKDRFPEDRSMESTKKVNAEIFNENKENIKAVGLAAKKKEIEKFSITMQGVCEDVTKKIAEEPDSNTFTADDFSLIVASGMRQFTSEDWKEFIGYMRENKEDRYKLKELGADFWQRIYFLDKNALSTIKTCGCKEIVLSEGFKKFINWIFQESMKHDNFNRCLLEKNADIYKNLKQIIDEDPNKHRETIVAEMINC